LTLETTDQETTSKPEAPAEIQQSSGHARQNPPTQPAGKTTVDQSISQKNSPRGDLHADIVVIGAGPGGYTAAFRAADLGKQVVLVERYATLGGVCLNVGCIPSKALLHAAKVISDAADMADSGIDFGKPSIDVDRLRGWKESIIDRLTKGLAGLARQRKVTVVQGAGRFESANALIVDTPEGARRITFDHCIVAAGSSVARVPGFPYDDPR